MFESLFPGLSDLSTGLPKLITLINFLIFLAKNPSEITSRKLKIILGSISIIYFLPKIEKCIYFFGFVLISVINKFKFSIDAFKFS